MRFSIVTIAFNQVDFIESALRSVLGQDYPDLEYIVVDPGSTDGTRDIIERYRDRISKVIYRSDRGAAEGLNNGFAAATGDILGFLNSDDLLLPGAIARVARQFREQPGVDLVMGHMRIVDREGRYLRNAYNDRFNARAYAYGACTICQQSTFFRAARFRETRGFNLKNTISWDSELFVDMLGARGKPAVIDEFLSAFRVYSDSITGGRGHMAAKRDFFEARFQRILGRPWTRRDEVIRYLYLARKYLLQPRSLYQRLVHGPIVKRSITERY
jgi:glycosyltransferase involved in cell wall biosynthesis